MDPDNFATGWGGGGGSDIWGGGGLTFSVCFLIIKFHRGPYEPPLRSNWTHGPIASQGRSVPVCLKKSIATCDFPAWGLDPLDFSGSAHVYIPLLFPYPTNCIKLSK